MAAPRTKLSKVLSIHATLDDVEKKKHKKNPFDGKYVNFCLADLTEVGQKPCCLSLACVAADLLQATLVDPHTHLYVYIT